MDRIYLDYSATTYVDNEVVEAMTPYFNKYFGNPSGVYSSGRETKAVIETCRKNIADFINADNKNEIYFTSCGTESDNWALKGAAFANSCKGKHIITTSVEHHAVHDTCKYLESNGFDITYIPVDEYGMVSVDKIKDAVRDDTILISVIFANNEVGTINPIAEIGAFAREKGIIFHTDAVQATGHLPIDVNKLNIDMLSASAHKFYGPKGIGFLYARRGCRIDKFIHGGAQERNMRAGTENVPYIVGMEKALSLACLKMDDEARRLNQLRDYMINQVSALIPSAKLNGHPVCRLPGHVNFSFEYIEAEASLLSLDLAGVECSSGSACASGALEPSYVLTAMGLTPEQARGALRFTMGRGTTKEQIDYTVGELKKIFDRLLEISPLVNKRMKEK